MNGLFQAVRDGYEKSSAGPVRAALNNGADPNFISTDGWSALSLLYAFHSDFNMDNNSRIRDHDRQRYAAAREIAGLLLDAGADVNQPAADGTTPLHGATRRGDADSVLLLLSYGANPEASNAEGYTPLHTAIRSCCAATVKILLDNSGCDINSRASDLLRNTPLELCLESPGYDSSMVETLVRAGATLTPYAINMMFASKKNTGKLPLGAFLLPASCRPYCSARTRQAHCKPCSPRAVPGALMSMRLKRCWRRVWTHHL